MVMAMYSTWAERKVAAFLQDRVGPNRAGWGGLLQPLADGMKLFAKEEFEPDTKNRFLFFVGPAIAMSTALMTSAVIPWGDKLHIFGRDVIFSGFSRIEHGTGAHIHIANSWRILVTIIQIILGFVGIVLEGPTGRAVCADDGYVPPVGGLHHLFLKSLGSLRSLRGVNSRP